MYAVRLTDKSEIRNRLNSDREWCLYALADLDDGLFEHCDWWSLSDGLALVFRGLDIRPILIVGGVESTRALLTKLAEPSGYLNLKPCQLESAAGIYAYRKRNEMYRMILPDFQHALHPGSKVAEMLSSQHRSEIEDLYATGDGGGIAFAPFQLNTGLFRGIREGGDLVAVAGVHVVSESEGVAGVGNIFTRPDCRGRGLAQIVTSAVITGLKEIGIRTIGLNVETTNAAIRVYERLGFRTRFRYYEGIADKVLNAFSDPGGMPDV